MTVPSNGIVVLYWTDEKSYDLDCEVSVSFHRDNNAEEKYSRFRKSGLCQFIHHCTIVTICQVFSI